MVINMSELFTVDGTVKTYEVPLEMSEVIWKRKKYPIVSKQPVELRLTHEGDRKIAITAKVSLVLEMPCDRCLDSVKALPTPSYSFKMTFPTNASQTSTSHGPYGISLASTFPMKLMSEHSFNNG